MARKKKMSGKKYGAGKGAPKMAGKPAILSLSRVTGKVAPSVKRGKISHRGRTLSRKSSTSIKKRGRLYK